MTFCEFAKPRGILIKKLVKVGQRFDCGFSTFKWSYVRYLKIRGSHGENFQNIVNMLSSFNEDIISEVANNLRAVLKERQNESLFPKGLGLGEER